jgi:thermitase
MFHIRRRYWVMVALLVGCQSQVTITPGGRNRGVGDPMQPSFVIDKSAIEPPLEVIVRFKDDAASVVDLTTPGLNGAESLADGISQKFRFESPEARDAFLAKMKTDPAVADAEPDQVAFLNGTPNDPRFGELWGHQKIQAPAAWDTITGNPGVIIADIDSGVDYNHPDLQGIGVIKGPDFVNNDSDPMDDNGHGSHVAGTIAAAANNGVGIAGVAYGAKILAIKVMDARGSGSLSAVASGILRAQQLGARVINLSLGGPSGMATLQNAINQVTAAGTLVVAAAGNDNTSAMSYPGAYDTCLCVGATDQSDRRAYFSNFGAWVDIAAPGVSILSTTQGGYLSWQGTSMATPHVAAAAGLLFSYKPTATPAEVRHALEVSGDPTTGFAGSVSMKRLNLVNALAVLGVTPTPTPTPTPSVSGSPSPLPTPTPTPLATPTPTPIPTPTPVPVTGRPFIYRYSISSPAADTIQFNWLTDIPSDTQLEYGTTASMGQFTPLDPAMVTTHVAQLANLAPNTTYFVRARSRSAGGAVGMTPIFRIILMSWGRPPTPAPTSGPTTAPTPTPTVAPTPSPTATTTAAPGGGGGGGGGGVTPTPTSTPTPTPTPTSTAVSTPTPRPTIFSGVAQ